MARSARVGREPTPVGEPDAGGVAAHNTGNDDPPPTPTGMKDPLPTESPSSDETPQDQHDNDAAGETGGSEQQEENEEEEEDGREAKDPLPALWKSRRFKGYLTIFLASIVNFQAALLSDEPLVQSAVPAQPDQQAYAKGVSLLSAIVTGLLVLVHLDRYSPLQSTWQAVFASHNAKSSSQSRFEAFLLVVLVLWWSVASVIQTSVRGIAGDGKEQYNLYYSTWVCCWTSLWCAERKLVDHGYPAFGQFVQGWPYRAPGWIAIFVCCFFTLWWYVDLFNNTKRFPERIPDSIAVFYGPIPRAQYQWLIFVAGITLLPSLVFVVAEILRASSGETPQKGKVESVLEGFCLLCLTIGWTPAVIVATTPGGFANLVGNAYFSTWATTVFVLETFLWYIHDWRGSVHRALRAKEQEYQDHQRAVLARTRAIRGDPRGDYDDPDDDDEYRYDTDDDDHDGSGDRSVQEASSDGYGAAEGHDDASIARERELRRDNRQAYFDALGDILG